MSLKKLKITEENKVFFKCLVKNPRSLGAILPSSKALSRFICNHVDLKSSSPILELGPGTGRFTRALLNMGCDPSRLYLIELDLDLCVFLRKNFPDVHVIHGDASQLDILLPKLVQGHVSTIISGIPLINILQDDIARIIFSCLSMLDQNGSLLQFTYGPLSPLPARKFGLKKKKLGYIFQNFPPACVWEYTKLDS